MRQQMGNISHSRKDYSHARSTPNRNYYYSHAKHATSLYTKSWLVLCDRRAMMDTALQTLMHHLRCIFRLSLSLSFAPALKLQQVFCFFLPPARNPKGYNLEDATGRFLNSYKNPKKRQFGTAPFLGAKFRQNPENQNKLENILSKYSLFFSGKKFAKFRPNF